MSIIKLTGMMALLFIISVTDTKTSSATYCSMTENSKGKVEYLLIPMKSEKHHLSPADLHEINHINSNREPINYMRPANIYRFRSNPVNVYPKYWKTPSPFAVNKYYRYPSYPPMAKNVKFQMKPVPRRPYPFITDYNPKEQVYINLPVQEPPSVMYTENGNEDNFQIIKSVSYALPPEITTYHPHEVAQHYHFDVPSKPQFYSDGKIEHADTKSSEQKNSPQVTAFTGSIQNPEATLPNISEQKESEDLEENRFKIVIPDQQYEEDVHIEETKQSTQNETNYNDQYYSDNRKPITFATRSVAHLQDESYFRASRPLYESTETDTVSKFDKEMEKMQNGEGRRNNTNNRFETETYQLKRSSQESGLYAVNNVSSERDNFVTVTPTSVVEN